MGIWGGFQQHQHQSIGDGGTLPNPSQQTKTVSFSTTSTTPVVITGSDLTLSIRNGRYVLLLHKGAYRHFAGSPPLEANIEIYKNAGADLIYDGNLPFTVFRSLAIDQHVPVQIAILDGPFVGASTPTYDVRIQTSAGSLTVSSAGGFQALEIGAS